VETEDGNPLPSNSNNSAAYWLPEKIKFNKLHMQISWFVGLQNLMTANGSPT
jgi:hypothetical protein